MLFSLLLSACGQQEISWLKEKPVAFFTKAGALPEKILSKNTVKKESAETLENLLKKSEPGKNSGSDFLSTLKYALKNDPVIQVKREDVDARMAGIETDEAQKDFQVNTILYGGIEDVTDNTKGLAVSLQASRLMFDGGMLDSKIASKRFDAKKAQLDLIATIDNRAQRLCKIWLELEKYQTLRQQIDSRLAVLDPLIVQLEQVANAGIGDVSKVTAAQRTVSAIRVKQATIIEGLSQAQLEFENAFGLLSQKISYDSTFVSNLVPVSITENDIQNAPKVLAQYADYQSNLHKLSVVMAEDEFNISFEAKAMVPFAGSEYGSDESIGLVGRKTLYNGGMLGSQIEEARSVIAASAAQITSSYREGVRAVDTAKQRVTSLDEAILLARKNAKLTADEILYLRQQLIIGGSTLDSVLSAEARLYEAESQEITLRTDKRQSELVIVATLGLLSSALDL